MIRQTLGSALAAFVLLGGCGSSANNTPPYGSAGSAAPTAGVTGTPAAGTSAAGTGTAAVGGTGVAGTVGVAGTLATAGTSAAVGGTGAAGTGTAGAGAAGSGATADYTSCAAADKTTPPMMLAAAAAQAIVVQMGSGVMGPCAFSSCHDSSAKKAGLILDGSAGTDLHTLLVGKQSCEASALKLVDASGGDAGLTKSWLWQKLTAPASAADGTLTTNAAWGTPNNMCGQMGAGEAFGTRMPMSGSADRLTPASKLKSIQDWICVGAP